LSIRLLIYCYIYIHYFYSGVWSGLGGSDIIGGDGDKPVESSDRSDDHSGGRKIIEDSSSSSSFIPTGFGRADKGRGAGIGGRGGGGQKSKGVNWNCPSCGNENWSWRETCNKCQSAKPASLLVSVFTYPFRRPFNEMIKYVLLLSCMILAQCAEVGG
jgi:hypothetical protein